MSDTVYAIVTERITKSLKAGVIPWRKPWKGGGAPKSLSTGRVYSGVNRLMLDPMVSGFSSCWWGTFNELRSRGGSVRKGSKASICVYWKLLKSTDKKTGEVKMVPFLRYYSVFNLDQCEGVEAPEAGVPTVAEFVPIEECERVVAGMPNAPSIADDGCGSCYYQPAKDSVHMAKRGTFVSPEAYYATLFHELVHSTGHKSRLGRLDKWDSFGSKGYAREELVAELGAAFLAADCHIDTAPIQESESAYIGSWLRRLAEDERLIVVAAGAASKAADYIHGRMAGAVEAEPVEAESLAVAA